MIHVEKFYDSLLSQGVDFFSGVPDSLLKDICAYITNHTPRERNIIAANEGCAVSIAVGRYMATGKLPLVYMQNSGLGNVVNPLLSLADEKVYSIPLLLMIGWRGEPGTIDEPQHKKQGEVTLTLLDAMNIPYVILEQEERKAISQIEEICISAKKRNMPHAIIIRSEIFEKYKLKSELVNYYELSREEALKLVIDQLHDNDIIVSTTGKLSRELFEYREAKKQSHRQDFLTVGSMGYSSSIALGIALEKQERYIYCLDGDGAFIMHMGGLSNIGNLSLKNYKHIVFNNGSHESVGGQPTLGFQLDIPSIVKACGYKQSFVAVTKESIFSALEQMRNADGPSLLEIKVKNDSRDNLGRPTNTPIENKKCFMDFLG